VHDDSKQTTLPIAREIADRYAQSGLKPPWYIDLLDINLDNHDLGRARARIEAYMNKLGHEGTRITENVDFVP
jgi:malate synthase